MQAEPITTTSPSLHHTTGDVYEAWSTVHRDHAELVARTLELATGLPWTTHWDDVTDNTVCVPNPSFPTQRLFWKG